MQYKGLVDAALVTNDMDKTVRFYQDVLGMSVAVTFAMDINGQRVRNYFFSVGSSAYLSFFEWPGVELPPRKDAGVPASGRQFDHVTIAVDSEKELVEIQERVRAAGITAGDVVDMGFASVIFFEDPNGITLAFAVIKKDLDQEPAFYDTEPVPALQPTS